MPKILIADDSAIARKTLTSLLTENNEWTICGEAANGRQAVLLAHQLKPDLIILDITMPMLDGFQAATEILRDTPAVPILFYTLHNSGEIALAGKKAGARKVVSKTDPREVLIHAIRELLPASEPSPPGQNAPETAVAEVQKPSTLSEAPEEPA